MVPVFNNQVALITGAGSGIGRQLAFALARHGAVIAAIDLVAEPLEKLVSDLKAAYTGGAWAIADVADRGVVRSAVTMLERRVGPIDILIANAGIAIEMPAATFRAEDFASQIRVNLLGVANSIETVLPGMLQRGHGHLVAISSLASYRGFPRMAGYCASKAGINALMDSLRVELAPHGIHCTTICPGWVHTPLSERFAVPKPGIVDAEAAVRGMVKAIVARQAFYAFPPRLRWYMRLFKWLPSGMSDWLIRRLDRG